MIKTFLAITIIASGSQVFGNCTVIPVGMVMGFLGTSQVNSNQQRMRQIRGVLKSSSMTVASQNRYIRLLTKLRRNTSRANNLGFFGLATGTSTAIFCGLGVDTANAATIVEDPYAALETNSDFRLLVDQVGIDRAVESMDKIANGADPYDVLDEVVSSLSLQEEGEPQPENASN